jgi:hypothetical protein
LPQSGCRARSGDTSAPCTACCIGCHSRKHSDWLSSSAFLQAAAVQDVWRLEAHGHLEGRCEDRVEGPPNAVAAVRKAAFRWQAGSPLRPHHPGSRLRPPLATCDYILPTSVMATALQMAPPHIPISSCRTVVNGAVAVSRPAAFAWAGSVSVGRCGQPTAKVLSPALMPLAPNLQHLRVALAQSCGRGLIGWSVLTDDHTPCAKTTLQHATRTDAVPQTYQ